MQQKEVKGVAYTELLYRPWAGATIKPALSPPPTDIIVCDNYRIAAIISDGQRDNVDEDLLRSNGHHASSSSSLSSSRERLKSRAFILRS